MDRFDACIEEQLNTFKKLPESVQKEINKSIKYKKSSLIGLANRCESPIEQLLSVYLLDVEENLYRELAVLSEFKSIHAIPQKEVIANNRKYRLDFMFECNTSDKNYYFAIECDGHDFHEKTKEQAAKDKARERNLMKEGYIVIRFTGSEICKNPLKCASEVSKIITKTVGLDDYYQELIDEMYTKN